MSEVRLTTGPDIGMLWHTGDPHAEQRALLEARAYCALPEGVILLTGPDRESWLDSLASHVVADSNRSLLLSPTGHIEAQLAVIRTDDALYLITERSRTEAVLAYLTSMRFMLRVELTDVSEQWHVLGWFPPAGVEAPSTDGLSEGLGLLEWRAQEHVPGAEPDRYLAAWDATWPVARLLAPKDISTQEGLQQAYGSAAPEQEVGLWAWEALRIAAGAARDGRDADDKSTPHEQGLIGAAVHLSKGCYRGQETVAKIYNLGRPPRRLTLLHLDGSAEELPEEGEAVLNDAGKQVGFVGTSSRHYENGPIALAVLKSGLAVDAPLTVGGIAAAQELVVTPVAAEKIRLEDGPWRRLM